MPNNQSFLSKRVLLKKILYQEFLRNIGTIQAQLSKSKNSSLANSFSLTPVSIEKVNRMSCPNNLKQNSDFFAVHVQKDINASISALKFPNDLFLQHY